MKRKQKLFSVLCVIAMLAGCLAGSAAAEEAAGPAAAEEACDQLMIRIDGPDERMPLEIPYEQFTDGSYRLEGLEAGEYTITEVSPETLLDGFDLQEDSITTVTVTVEGGKATEAALFNHYSPAEETEEPAGPAPAPTGEEETPAEDEPAETVSVSVRKEWDDQENILGLRPASITVYLSNGSSYVLHEGNGWSVTVDQLPAQIDGQAVSYSWFEQTVPGYARAEAVSDGSHTTLVNRLWQPPKAPAGQQQPKTTGTSWFIFEDYETPLGLQIMINHVGDCYE